MLAVLAVLKQIFYFVICLRFEFEIQNKVLLGGKMNGNNIEVRGSERKLPQNKHINSGNTTRTHVDVDVSQWP